MLAGKRPDVRGFCPFAAKEMSERPRVCLPNGDARVGWKPRAEDVAVVTRLLIEYNKLNAGVCDLPPDQLEYCTASRTLSPTEVS